MVEYSDISIRIVTALLVLLLGLLIANIVNNTLRRILRNIEINRIIHEQLNLKISAEEFSSSVLKYLIYFATVIIALNQLGFSTKVLQMVFIVFLVIVVVFVILSFKDFAPNLISGFYILKTGKLKKGDIIEINELKGKVLNINLVETKIETNNKELIFIPNSNITKFKVIKR